MSRSSLIARTLIASAACAAAFASAPASAIAVGDNVAIKNGDFKNEVQSFYPLSQTGWSEIDPTGRSQWRYLTTDHPNNDVNKGTFGLMYLDGWPGQHNSVGIYQDVGGLTVGAQYTLSCLSEVTHTDDPMASEYWQVTFGDQTLQGATMTTHDTWVESKLTFTATSTTQRLTFLAVFLGATPGATPEVLNLDNVTLTVSAVPEPATAALALSGLLGLGLLARRRKQQR